MAINQYNQFSLQEIKIIVETWYNRHKYHKKNDKSTVV